MAKPKKLKPGDAAPDGRALDADGQEVALATYWEGGAVLLTFLRHFGWIHCRDWLAQLELHREEIEAAGLRVVAVGLGQPRHARRYGDRLAPSVDCVTTEEAVLHKTYGVERGNRLRMVAPDALAAGVRAAARGQKQGAPTGDIQHLPGTFIVDAGGIVRYTYYSKHAGDHPDLPTLMRWWRESSQVEPEAID